MNNPFSDKKQEPAKSQHFVGSGQIRHNGKLLNPGDAVPDGFFDQKQLARMIRINAVRSVDSSPPQPAVFHTGEKDLSEIKNADWPFTPLPQSAALHPNELLGLDLEQLNEQAVTKGWDGEKFTDKEAVVAFLSNNFTPSEA